MDTFFDFSSSSSSIKKAEDKMDAVVKNI